MTDITLGQLLELHAAGGVKRYHTVPTIGQETIAAHSWGVALLILKLYPGIPSRELLAAAIYHDIPESVVGDTPANAKWQFPDLAVATSRAEDTIALYMEVEYEESLDKQERDWLRWCDLLDIAFYCHEQYQLGNRTVVPMMERVRRKLRDLDAPERVFELAQQIKAGMRESL